MLELLEGIDIQFFLYLNGLHNESFDFIMYWISDKKIWMPFYLFLLAYVIKMKGNKTWLFLICIAMSIAASDQFASGLCKPYFERYRPSHEIRIAEQIHIPHHKGGLYGFISSHAANTFALAQLMYLAFPYWYMALLFVWAFIVSYSRIYLGLHYPADMFFGALAGILISTLAFRMYQHIQK